MANVGRSRHCLCDLGISQPPQRDMQRDFAQYAKVGEVDADAEMQNPADLENLFLHQWMHYCTDCSFEMAEFKQKKGCATISLGLIYCSMGSSQPPSRDTCPFNKKW
jgi:hypothetical protein